MFVIVRIYFNYIWCYVSLATTIPTIFSIGSELKTLHGQDEEILAQKLCYQRKTKREKEWYAADSAGVARLQTSSPREAGNSPESSFLLVQATLVSLSLSLALFASALFPFPCQSSIPRDRRNPLPSFRNDDMKRVLMWVQLWGSIPIKTLSLLLQSSIFSLFLSFSVFSLALHSGFSALSYA